MQQYINNLQLYVVLLYTTVKYTAEQSLYIMYENILLLNDAIDLSESSKDLHIKTGFYMKWVNFVTVLLQNYNGKLNQKYVTKIV